MKRFRIERLEPKGWDMSAEITSELSTAFAVAERASEHPTPARARVEDVATGVCVAVFEAGQCVELHGKAFP